MLAPSCVVTAWWYCVREECVMGCVMLYDRVKLSLFDSCTAYAPTIPHYQGIIYSYIYNHVPYYTAGS